MTLISNFILAIRYFCILLIYGATFPFRKIPVCGFLFWPLEIFTLPHIKYTKGERIVRALIALGPTFIKLGQTLATRPDIVGQDMAKHLTKLQDRLPAFKGEKSKKIIRQDLGDITQFAYFDPQPVAAASIAQVHKAELHDGRKVAVKILRPNASRNFARDLSLLLFIAKIIDIFPRFKRLKLPLVILYLRDITNKELDLRIEAANASKLRENLSSNNNIIIPKIYWNYTSKNILTSDWIEGIKINQIEALKEANIDLKQLSKNLILAYFDQAYRDGFFHGDMHPGNILVTKEHKIAFLDFGIMGQLNLADKIYVTRIIEGFIKRDYDYIAKMHYDAGYVPRDTNLHEFSLACRSIGEPIFGLAVTQVSIAKMLAQLFQITEQFGMETQPQLLLLQKTLLIIEGVGSNLDPELNIWELGEPWMQEWVKENLSAKATIKRSGEELIIIAKKIPELCKNLEELIQNSNSSLRQQNPWFLITATALITAIFMKYIV